MNLHLGFHRLPVKLSYQEISIFTSSLGLPGPEVSREMELASCLVILIFETSNFFSESVWQGLARSKTGGPFSAICSAGRRRTIAACVPPFIPAK